ncbi:anti-sigma factor [Promicromonospora sp. NPDC050249]|uniref:anti-sigma factor n=1 Tax=Promicromonospora sp. NPDC050249 TaxID=3154743 RepID=UPI0034075894
MADETSTGARSPRSDAWDLLPGYALDALGDADRRAVERLLESDAEARRSLDEYRDVVAAFAVETEPPAALRASVLELVQSTPQLPVEAAPAPEAGDGVVVDLASRRRKRWGVAVAAVAAAAAIAVPTTIAVQVTAERDRLREQSQVVAEMLADPDSAILRGAIEGGGQASVLVADDDMFFRAEDLPDLAADRAYQLWVVAEDGSVSSAGVLSVRDGESTSLVQGSEGVGMAVTVEPASGSEQPTSDPVVVLGA